MQVQTTVTKSYSDRLNLDPSVDFGYNIQSSGRVDFTNGNQSWGDMPLETIQSMRDFFEEMCYIKECLSQGRTPRARTPRMRKQVAEGQSNGSDVNIPVLETNNVLG